MDTQHDEVRLDKKRNLLNRLDMIMVIDMLSFRCICVYGKYHFL